MKSPIRLRLEFLILMLLAASRSPGQLPPTPKEAQTDAAGPRLFVGQRILELGTVLEGDTVPLVWTLENRGSAELKILTVSSSCGCTVVKLTEEEKIIPPQKSLTLNGSFDSTGRLEEQHKTITVYTNDPMEPELQLEVRAKVDFLFTMDPPGMVNVRAVRRGEPAERALDILPGPGKKSLEISSIEVTDGQPLEVKAEPFVGKTGPGQRLRFVVPELAAMGPLQSMVKFKVIVDGVERQRAVAVRGEIVGDLTFLPKVLDATRQPSLPGKKMAPVTINATDKSPLTVLGVEAGPLFDISVDPPIGSAPAREHGVHLTLREGAPSGPFASRLDIRTSSLDQPLIQIPVFGIVADRIEIEPPLILLRNDDTPVGTRRRVKIQTAGATVLDIAEITCDQPAVSVTVDKAASARYKHLKYLDVVLTGNVPKGVAGATIRMSTNVAGAELLEIPVTIESARQ